MSFKEMLNESLTKAKMTQKELAEKLGVSSAAITKWKCGECKPEIETLELLCDVLSLDKHRVESCFEYANNELLSIEKFVEEFDAIDNCERAAIFIDGIFYDFEMDSTDNVTMRYILKLYSIMTLLKTIDERSSIDDEDYSVETFVSNIQYGLTKGEVSKYREYIFMYYEMETKNEIQRRLATFSSAFFDDAYVLLESSGSEYRFEIYLHLLMEHIRSKFSIDYTRLDKYNWF